MKGCNSILIMALFLTTHLVVTARPPENEEFEEPPKL